MAQPALARFRKASLAVKQEVTYNLDPVLAAADIVQMRNVLYGDAPEIIRDERVSGLIAPLPDIIGAIGANLAGEAFLRGFGAAYSASNKPEVSALLRALAFAEAGSFGAGTEKYDYTPQAGATMGESVTAALFAENTTQGKLTGAFIGGRITMRGGEPASLAIAMTGLYNEPADVALITAAPSAVQPPVFKSGAVSLDGVTTLLVGAITVEIGVVLNYVRSANAVQAYGAVVIADRMPRVTMDVAAVTAATYNFYNKRDTRALFALSWQVGTVQYNRIKFSAPKAQIVGIRRVQRDGVWAFELDIKLNANAGADELTISFD